MKINVGVFFGGKSVEHEVAVITAVEAMNALDKNKYNVIPIYITKEGEFYTGKDMFDIHSFKDIPTLLDKSTNVTVSVNEKEHSIINNEAGLFFKKVIAKIDIAFPIMHGTNGEDGTIQGLFELMNIPYVGSNIVASANGMDKITMKMILKETGLPVVPFVWFFSNKYFDNKETILRSINNSIDFPMIVKPANLGSSVGISTARNMQELEEAIDTATSYSGKIIVEKMIENLREINVSVLGDYEEAYPSVCEEPLRSGDILSYNDKYAVGAKGGSKNGNHAMADSYHKMPADLPDEIAKKMKECAVMTFVALNCSGVARVDFLMDSTTNEVFVNEINTIPGSLSYYFWELQGMSFSGLLDKLIELAVKKHKEKNKLIFTNNINILSLKGKGPDRSKSQQEVNTYDDYNSSNDMNDYDNTNDNNSNESNNETRITKSLKDLTEEISDEDTFSYEDYNNLLNSNDTNKNINDNNEDYSFEEDIYDNDNPILNDNIESIDKTMVQMSLDETNANKFNEVLDSEVSKGTSIDYTVGDVDLSSAIDALDVNLDSDINAPMFDDIDSIELDEIKTVEQMQKEKEQEQKNNANNNTNFAARKNTAEPFGLLKVLNKNNNSNNTNTNGLSAFENPDAFSNGDLKIKGVKNNKKGNKKGTKTSNTNDNKNAFDEFFGPDNN
ncbi:MAG: D-alanine--D-alanine ligase [Clostridia bacterium]|nr:D-alanine--D-alanine ligase [Clostridia bacterium]